jgi:4-oxalocrotonate tautomerase
VILLPVITIDGPKLSKEQKEELVKLFSEDASRVTGLPVDAMVVIIREADPENVGVRGCLLCDLQPDK